jgi:hypothetical protein
MSAHCEFMRICPSKLTPKGNQRPDPLRASPHVAVMVHVRDTVKGLAARMKKNQLAAGAVPEPAHSPDVLEKTRNELEFARLRTERQKLALDIRLKRRELAIEPRKAWKELLGNPFTIAIMGGFITLMTQIVVNRLNVSTNSELESTKASLAADSEKLRADLADKSAYKTLQADLIKKFVESPEKETVRNNLTFLVEADLLPNYAEGIRKYLKDHPFQAPQVGSGGDGCGGVTVGTLPVVRKRFLNEVQDLNIRRLIAASTAAEVGGQGSEAEQYYIESVFNRATSRHKTLRETLMDGPPYGYYPSSTINQLGTVASREDQARIDGIIDSVMAGSNGSNFATENASGSVRSGGAPVTRDLGPGKERFLQALPDRNWVRCMVTAAVRQSAG